MPFTESGAKTGPVDCEMITIGGGDATETDGEEGAEGTGATVTWVWLVGATAFTDPFGRITRLFG